MLQIDCIMSIFSKFWLSVRTVWDYTIDGVFSVFCCCWQKHIPPVSNPIVLESATTLAEKIRNQQLKVESVVTAFIERINEVNGVLNAIVANRFEEALKEARQIDRDIEDGKITAKEFSEKPLLGKEYAKNHIFKGDLFLATRNQITLLSEIEIIVFIAL